MHHHDGADWMPHVFCFQADPAVLWRWVLGNGGTAVAYVVIAAALAYMTRRLPQVLPRRAALLFAPFIFFCGIGHAIEIWTLWRADYLFQATWSIFTLAASIPAAVGVVQIIPRLAAIVDGADAAVAKAEALTAELERREAAEQGRKA